MSLNKIYFKGNPWTHGNKIKDDIILKFLIKEDNLLYVYLEFDTFDYSDEAPDPSFGYDNQDAKNSNYDKTGWAFLDPWLNYGYASFKLNEKIIWDSELQDLEQVFFKEIIEFEAAPLPINYELLDKDRNHCYVLGHGDVVGHKIKLIKLVNGNFDVEWNCKYVDLEMGSLEERHDILISLYNIDVKLPSFINKIELVKNFEGKISYSLPLDYRNFLIKFNGKNLENKPLYIPDCESDVIIQNYLGISLPSADIEGWLEELKDDLDQNFLPIAVDPGGNFLLMNKIDGKVYYWDSARHFSVSSDIQNTFWVADSFSDLISKLR